MDAATSRAFVRDNELGEHIAKIVADAPELTDVQRKTLSAIFTSRNGETPALQPAPADDNQSGGSGVSDTP